MLTTMVVVIFSLLLMPFRLLWRTIRRKKRLKPWVKRLIVVGLDGQDPQITERFMKEGKLPNFAKLAEMGCYRRLRTTFPSLSPTAWSSFATGTDPAKHNIFDFLGRDTRTYLPVLSSAHIGDVERFLKIGKYRIPLKKPELRLLRKSKPSWTILGEHEIWSTVLRVPITSPPEQFHGAQLSAMCTPDLLGSQGTFFLYTTRPAETKFKEGGIRVALPAGGERFETSVKGPENAFLHSKPPLEVPMSIVLDRAARQARVQLDGTAVDLKEKELSDWITLSFKAAPGIKVSANCRMMVTEMGEHFSLYMTPLNIDPENPAMPISHPSYYATYLAKRIGPYCTLGLAEDTWALNEGVIDDATFLKQAYDIDREREQMFFVALDRLRKGTLTCVFDGVDRIQHMFWRYFEKGHPAARGAGANGHADAIEKIYRHSDELVGKVMARLGKGDLMMVVSDHGFASFRRGVNLNAWLLSKGWLALKEGGDGTAEWLRDVDWSRTRAYALGLTGMFLNIEGREAKGIVKPGDEAARVKAEIMAALKGLRDTGTGETAVNEAFDTAKLYSGPYLPNAPDLIIGFNAGYRTSWDGATGVVSGPVFEDNTKAWSGDHCIDPRLVPGVFFASRKIDRKDPSLVDIAPTVLRLFGLDPPAHMDGKPLYERAFAGD
ncbi:MAG: nucleotide pyrophosphatase [Acidobacteria bacterium]|nr:MAG: nucleotide pyrophosphatase [Acidobacteriota bacterium]